ncbi:MAG: YlmH/Sll1252 family protein [Eubacteriales bacterium]
MNKDEELLRNRLIELSKISYERGIITYSNFLNLSEQDCLQRISKRELFSTYDRFGGYELAERQMIAFLPDALYYENFYPLTTLKIEPKAIKYSEKLTHRDYLGSILGLGIERNKIGDILLFEDCTIVFVHETISNYILDSLTKIRNTFVTVRIIQDSEITFSPAYVDIKGTVASIRLDSILALVLKESRSRLIRLIEGGKVYVNGKLITTNAYKLQEQDIISVRGHGKFQFDRLISTTKKDRLYINIKKYT